jgi:hypothetical protein
MYENDETVRHLVARVAEAVEQLAELHVELVKAEIARDVKAVGRDVAPLALGMPLLGAGYLLGCVAAALALAPWLGSAGGFAFISGANVLVGAAGVYSSLSKKRFRGAFGGSPWTGTVCPELQRSVRSLLAAARRSVDTEPPTSSEARDAR